MVTASWVSQSIESDPQMVASVAVGGDSFLIPGSGPSVVRAAADGSFTEYTLDGPVGKKSVALAGTVIYMTGTVFDSPVYRGLLQMFETTTNTVTSVVFDDPAVSDGPRYGAGALGPDGLIYFPPLVSVSGEFCSVLVVDPSTGGISFTNFGGTFVTGIYGHACMGGDGRMYFLPGISSASGGVSYSGTYYGVIDFTTGTFTALSPPLELSILTPAGKFVWAIAAPDGVYGGSSNHTIHKFTATGGTRLWEVPLGTLISSAVVGADGLIYSWGADIQSTGQVPMLVWIDPATDAVTSESFPGMGGPPNFFPVVTYRVGPTIRGFAAQGFGAPPYPDMIIATIGGMSNVYFGALPLTLYYGAIPLTAAIR